MNELNNDMRGFKREAKGKKEEFHEKLLYELYKEYPFDNSREIRYFMLKHHGVYASTNLITAIMNYQIRKYGQRKSSGKSLTRIYNGHYKTNNRRNKEHGRQKEKKYLNKLNNNRRYNYGHKR